MEKLGIDPVIIAIQILNFAVLLWILNKYLYKPVLELLKKRQQVVEDTDKLQKKLDAEKVSMDEEKEKILSEAHKEANELLTDMKSQGETIKSELENEAREQAQQIRTRAEEHAEKTEQNLRRELEQNVQDAAVKAAETALGQSITPEQRQAVLEQAAKEFSHGS